MPSRLCAVVLPSLLLLGAHQGDRIDSYDEVIRFNMHTGEGHANDFGSRTTLILSNQHALDEHSIGRCVNPATRCVLTHDRANIDKWRFKEKGTAYWRDVMYLRNGTVTLFSHAQNRLVEERFLQCRAKMNATATIVASTGFRAMYYLRNICSRIDIFGFEVNKKRAHYKDYDTGHPVWKGHDYFVEHTCILNDDTFAATLDNSTHILTLVPV